MIHLLRDLFLLLGIHFVGLSGSGPELEAELYRDESGTCQSSSEPDCIEGLYTSFLQESLKFASHQRVVAHESPIAKLAPAHGGGGTSQVAAAAGLSIVAASGIGKDHLWMITAGVTCALLLFYLACLRPAMVRGADSGQDPTRQNYVRSRSALAVLVNTPPDMADDETTHRIHDNLEEDTYSLAIAMLVRDFRSLELGEGKRGLKLSRIGYSIALVLLTSGVTIALLMCIKQFVTPMQVADIRDAYANFEQVMYNNHTYLNLNGKMRGTPGFFNASLFEKLTDDQREAACNIPFSQFPFLCLILIVWSITCVACIKKCFGTFVALILFGPTVDSMKKSLTYWEQATAEDEEHLQKGIHDEDLHKGVPVQVITGLTPSLKLLLVLLVFLPEFCTTSYLLWLGCRWLTATNSFSDIVCNAVALEFILQLKCLLYLALVSERNKRELAFTAVPPPTTSEAAGYTVYFSTLCWLLVSFAWVYFYIFYFQTVLPDYHWDVHQVCNSWLLNILAKSGGPAGE